MSSSKKMIADLLFGVQIIGAVVFCGAYILRSREDVTGSSVAQFGLVAAFLVFNLGLGVGAHHAAPSRITKQAIWTYIVWLVLVAELIRTVATHPAYGWNAKDSTTLVTAFVLTLALWSPWSNSGSFP